MKNKLGGCRGSFMCKAERCINACSITPKKSSVFSFWGCPQQTIIMMQTNVICSYYVCTLAADPMSMYTNIYRMLTYIMQVQPSWWLFRHYLVVRSSWLSKLINSSRSTCFLESDNCTNSYKYLHIYRHWFSNTSLYLTQTKIVISTYCVRLIDTSTIAFKGLT